MIQQRSRRSQQMPHKLWPRSCAASAEAGGVETCGICIAISHRDRTTLYAQIEKEALAATWASEKFSDYVLGKHFELETDHKSLVPLLSNKQFPLVFSGSGYDWISSTIQSSMSQGRSSIPQTPSREHLPQQQMRQLQNSRRRWRRSLLTRQSAGQHLHQYRQKQVEDPICSLMKQFCCTEWPT